MERERSQNDPDAGRGTVTGEEWFEMYIENFVVPVLGKYCFGEPRSVVFMDNASVHNGETVRELIQEAGARIVFTPPYSPDLNPIEFMFGEYKKFLKRISTEDLSWTDQYSRGLLESVSPEMGRAFYRKTLVPGCEDETNVTAKMQGIEVLAVAAYFVMKINDNA